MAAHERLPFKLSFAPTLAEQLAKSLPQGASFKLYHVSTPPNRESAIYSAPPGGRPERTYCESHFLSVSIDANSASATTKSRDVLAFAIEVLIYSTAYLTTFFVSKADSTGYLHLLKLPKGSPSPLREICSTFLTHLVDRRKRNGIPSVVSLFARAQDQYLFPGSVDNAGKHVLDDRGLVRWWCRVLDPLAGISLAKTPWESIDGYLTVPGLDKYETTAFIPMQGVVRSPKWTVGHPLQQLSLVENLPPRCLIPHFPDDPKSRFLDELDDELTSSHGNGGEWKSVKSLAQFWEMMAFRQECSSGRLVGFIWMVFKPVSLPERTESVKNDSQSTSLSFNSDITTIDDSSSFPPATRPLQPITPNRSFGSTIQMGQSPSPSKPMMSPPTSSQIQPFISPSRAPVLKKKKKKLAGPIIPRQPRIKTKNRSYFLERPEKTAYYSWPKDGRGQVILDEKDYKRMTELLQRLDFENLDLAVGSTRRWIMEVRSGAAGDISGWGTIITGTKPFETKKIVENTGGVTMLNVRKKRKADGGSGDPAPEKVDEPVPAVTPAINVLGASMVRKKAKA